MRSADCGKYNGPTSIQVCGRWKQESTCQATSRLELQLTYNIECRGADCFGAVLAPLTILLIMGLILILFRRCSARKSATVDLIFTAESSCM
jgi:hypothetical protein